MGFRIEIDEHDASLLSLLRSNPAEVFSGPYCGYLLFLAGGADQQILEWISQNLASLDSLTGDDIAFGVFARRFPFTLRTHEESTRTRARNSVGTVSLDEARNSYSISRLCKSGRFGWIVDGDELNAVTYAVDDIARGFGVLGELPCMIVLDGIPAEKFDVLPLDNAATDKLIPLLRKAIAKFRRGPTFEAYVQSVREIVRILGLMSITNKLKEADELKLETLRKELSARVKSEVINLSNARDDLLNGKLRGLRRRLQNTRLLDGRQVERIISLVDERHATLMQYSRTVAALRRLIGETEWPLDSESFKRYEICDEYARTLLGTSPSVLSGESPDQCLQILSLLEESQQRTVNEIMEGIPNEQTLKEKAIEKCSTELNSLEERLANVHPNLQKWRTERLSAAIKEHNRLEHPTLSKVFAKLAREERLVTIKRSVIDNAYVFAGSIFKPEILLKIWGAIT